MVNYEEAHRECRKWKFLLYRTERIGLDVKIDVLMQDSKNNEMLNQNTHKSVIRRRADRHKTKLFQMDL